MPDDWNFSTIRRQEPSLPVITYGFSGLCILLTCAYHFPGLSPLFARLGVITAPSGPQIWSGAYWGLFTTFFIHGDAMHILFNLSMFVPFGRAMEAELPPWAYVLFLAAAAAVSCGCEIALMGQPGIGASGALYAMIGLMWIGRGRYAAWRELATDRNMKMALIWGVFCIFGTVAGFMHIANVAHFSGLLFGLSVGALFLAPRRKMLWAVPLTLLIVLSSLSLFWLPWNAEWHNYRASKAFAAKQYMAAIESYHRSLRLGGSRYFNWENIKRAWQNIGIDAAERGDTQLETLAQQQADSAERLEGPDPSLEQEKPDMPSFHMPGTHR